MEADVDSNGNPKIWLHKSFAPWFNPYRYKFALGGRDSGKSTAVGTILLLTINRSSVPLRVLCGREKQNSIQESVKTLLEDLIKKYNWSNQYRVLKTMIENTRNGSQIYFKGISDMTVDSVKSMEAIDIAWLEEAQCITDNSWRIFGPTIRKPGSEIWGTMNPRNADDPCYRRAISDRDNVLTLRINIEDNPFASEESKRDMADDFEEDALMAEHTWHGALIPHLDGAIYGKQLADLIAENRCTSKVPYEPGLPVSIAFDIGKTDATAIVFAQQKGLETHIIDYYENSGEYTDHYVDIIRRKGYRIDEIILPHDCYAERIQAPESFYTQMCRAFPHAYIARKEEMYRMAVSVMDGISAVRRGLRNTYIDCELDQLVGPSGILARYCWHRNIRTEQEIAPDHSKWSHGADALRYLYVGRSQYVTGVTTSIKSRKVKSNY